MATLTETAQFIRKAVKWGTVTVLLILVIKLGISVGREWWRRRHPEPPPPPDVAFGKLPAIRFPEQKFPEISFRLETISGGTPDLGDRATVFFMPYKKPSLLALDRAKEQAKKWRFLTEPVKVNDKTYRWVRGEEVKTVLEMNIFTGEFELNYNWRADPVIFQERALPGEKQAVMEAVNFLTFADLLPEDLDTENGKVSYLKLRGGQIVEAISLSEANMVRVDFFRKPIGDWPVMTEDPNKGVVSFLFSGSTQSDKRIVEVSYHYFPVDYQSTATYPIKNSALAWRELQAHQGYVAALGDNQEGKVVTIRSIYLAYLDSKTPVGYLMPIYVFEGDGGFYGYVSAIEDEWLE